MDSERKQVVLREVKNGAALTLTPDCEVAEIRVNEVLLRRIEQGNLQDQDHHDVFTIHWDSRKCMEIPSYVLKLHYEDEIGVISKLIEKGHTRFHELIGIFYEEFNTKIVSVHIKPFQIELTHDSKEDLNRFKELCSSDAVTSKIRNLLRKSTNIGQQMQQQNLVDPRQHEHSAIAECNIPGLESRYQYECGHRQFKDPEYVHKHSSCEEKIQESETYKQLAEALKAKVLGLRSPENQAIFQTILSQISERRVEEPYVRHSFSDDDVAKPLPRNNETSPPDQETAHQETGFLKEIPCNQVTGCFQETTSDHQETTSDHQETFDQSEPMNHRASDQNIISVASPHQVTTLEETAALDKEATLDQSTSLDQGASMDVGANLDQCATLDQGTTLVQDATLDQGMSLDQGALLVEGAFPHEAVTFDQRSTLDQRSTSHQQRASSTNPTGMTESTQPSKCNGLDTVLIINTTLRIGEKGFAEMKRIITFIIKGIEEAAMSCNELEENIAVVVFGKHVMVLHQPSNDYSTIIEAIEGLSCGGESILIEALDICQASLEGVGSLTVRQVHQVPSRYIIITDGRDGQQGKMELIYHLNTNQYTKASSFIWIPIGHADMESLTAFAKLSKGKVIDGNDRTQLTSLCRYQHIQIAVAQIFHYINEEPFLDQGSFEENLLPLVGVFVSDASLAEQSEIIQTVKDKIDRKDGCGNPDQTDNGLAEIIENENLLAIGTRVRSGPDWQTQNVDLGGFGTVYSHSRNNQGLLSVMWDNGVLCEHRFGHENAYEVWPVQDSPRNLLTSDALEGCEVTRGRDWQHNKFEEEDGGPGCVGVIIRIEDNNRVKVRWRETCCIGTYRFNKNGVKDVVLRDVDGIVPYQSRDNERQETSFSEAAQEPKAGKWVWQWKDNGNNSHPYAHDVNVKLEKDFSSSNRSCLIQREGKSHRVIFKDMIETSLSDQSRRGVTRTFVED